ncbi:hypothetical protein OV203_18390 [Nannocystis sp. ILAH1]|uniref:hypothetical protein n=1 Tax=unclassified Nannocystis TaxID=2627009 RepID=UPI002272111D|nr:MULTISPECIES: hypothetical protein [unclassified Nannocystis]MCY0989112.1 hypothetical protein [Nannocystis sp. ILAH1]MCY1067956.1 hypothetical protein [Nannocystis sp. RBIL2]
MSHAVAVAGLLACGSPEPSSTTTESSTVNETEASTGPSSSTGDASGPGASDGTTGTDGSSEGTTGTGAPTSTTASETTETGAAAPSFAEVYESVFMQRGCLSNYCHGGTQTELVMSDEAVAYANLVGSAATEASCDLSVRVVPGAPEESVLWRRVRPAALDAGDMCAAKMPLGTMGLEEAEAQLVYDWIAAGAPR